jgi:hypothetical protein
VEQADSLEQDLAQLVELEHQELDLIQDTDKND